MCKFALQLGEKMNALLKSQTHYSESIDFFDRFPQPSIVGFHSREKADLKIETF